MSLQSLMSLPSQKDWNNIAISVNLLKKRMKAVQMENLMNQNVRQNKKIKKISYFKLKDRHLKTMEAANIVQEKFINSTILGFLVTKKSKNKNHLHF